MSQFSIPESNLPANKSSDQGLPRVLDRLVSSMARDQLVGDTIRNLRNKLEVDRVVLYYFYRQWQGQVTFEALGSGATSILGSTGPDECFNQEYAQLYLEGRVRAIANIEQEPIHSCHRDFLRSLKVQANLVVPVLTIRGLWGLLVAHHCQAPRPWSVADIQLMQVGAKTLATASCIQAS